MCEKLERVERLFKIFARGRFFLFCLFCSVVGFYAFVISASLKVELPSTGNRLLFYSNQTRDDLGLVFKKAIQTAKKSICITMYTLSDPLILKWLERGTSRGILTKIYFDPSAGEVKTSSLIETTPLKTKGLMHKKLVVIDSSLVFLGSANMTTASLKLHDNLTLGLYSPEVAQFLEEGTSSYLPFSVGSQRAELYLLPDTKQKESLTKLISTLDNASSSIFIAMFTLTHPAILEALLRAKIRGVEVCVALDFFTARGASKKAVEKLSQANIQLIFSRGQQLLHHKWALIDSHTFITGSTNWTTSAFKKNQDCLLFLYDLLPAQQKYLRKLRQIVEVECIE